MCQPHYIILKHRYWHFLTSSHFNIALPAQYSTIDGSRRGSGPHEATLESIVVQTCPFASSSKTTHIEPSLSRQVIMFSSFDTVTRWSIQTRVAYLCLRRRNIVKMLSHALWSNLEHGTISTLMATEPSTMLRVLLD